MIFLEPQKKREKLTVSYLRFKEQLLTEEYNRRF